MIGSFLIHKGIKYSVEYEDADSFDGLPKERIQQAYGVCFVDDKIILGYGGKNEKRWNLIGGTVESGETVEETLTREVKEESNMKILMSKPIGYQKVISPTGDFIYQLRSCCKVEPYGEFISDPAGEVDRIELIDPRYYKKYFDWGEIGERIIQRAIELSKTF